MVFFVFVIPFVKTSKRVFTVFCNHVKWCVFSYPVLYFGIKLPYYLLYTCTSVACSCYTYILAYCARNWISWETKIAYTAYDIYLPACGCVCLYYALCVQSIRMSSRSCGGGGGRLRRVPVDSPRVICLIVLRFFNHCPRHSDEENFLPLPPRRLLPGPSLSLRKTYMHY